MRKIIAILSAAIILFTVMIMPVSAYMGGLRGSVMIYAQSFCAEPGSDVDIAVSISGSYQANVLNFFLEYDDNVLQIAEEPEPGAVWTDIQNNEGTVMVNTQQVGHIGFVAVMPEDSFSSTGAVFTVKFHILAASNTTTPLNVRVTQFSLDDFYGNSTPVSYTAKNGFVNICTPPDPNGPKVIVVSKSTTAGKSVVVDIKLENNPGFVMMTLTVNFDSRLELTGVTDTGLIPGSMHSAVYGNPYALVWMNPTATENITANGVVAQLEFTVPDGAPVGEYPVTVSYDYENYDIANYDSEPVMFGMVNGSVNVIDVIFGDVNSDTRVNNLDSIVLARYLARWANYPASVVNMNAADVDMNSRVNNLDSMILARHLARWQGYETLPHVAKKAETCTEPTRDNPTVTVGSVTGQPGETVTVDVTIADNPGFVMMTLTVDFDSRLTLLSVEDTNLIPGKMHSVTMTNPYSLVWMNQTALQDCTANGVIARLTFQLPDDASGEYYVNISYDYDNYDIVNFDSEPVLIGMVKGVITVSVPDPGDEPEIPDGPAVVVESVTGEAGEAVVVDVELFNNPGFVMMTLTVDFDSRLTLLSVEDTNLIPGKMHSVTMTNPYSLVWMNQTALQDCTANGTIAKLTFQIPDGAEAGEYPINISYDYDNYDIVNFNSEPVLFNMVSGSVNVSSPSTDPTVPVGPTISVGSVTGQAGDTVTVDIDIANNPGIVMMTLTLDYDSRLTLLSVEDTNLIPGKMHSTTITNPYVLVWMNQTALQDCTANGTIAKLTFQIPNGAEAGEYSINISYDYDNYDIVNFDSEPVLFSLVSGGITVDSNQLTAPVVLGYHLELRNRAETDGKADLRFVFKVEFNDSYIKFNGTLTGPNQNGYQIQKIEVSIQAEGGENVGVVKVRNLWDMKSEAETPYFLFTVVVSAIPQANYGNVINAVPEITYQYDGLIDVSTCSYSGSVQGVANSN